MSYLNSRYRRKSVPAAPTTARAANPSVILINGQSNAAAIPPQYLGYSAANAYLGSDIQCWYQTAGAFAQAIDGSANTIADASGNGDGPGPGLGLIGSYVARQSADAGNQPVRCFALARSGKGISYFLPTEASDLAEYEDGSSHGSLNNYNLLKAQVVASGHTVQAIIWCQGEANAGTTQRSYYDSMRDLLEAWALDYPAAHVYLVTTIGDASGEIGGTDITAIRAAQAELATENPHVHLVDTSDMEGQTAWFGSANDTSHYTKYAGYDEVARRVWATMQSTTRSDVAEVDHCDDVISWEHRWLYRRAVTGVAAVQNWQNDISAKSFGIAGVGPTHLPNVAAIADRSATRWNGSDNTLTTASLDETGTTWTIFGVAKLNATGAAQMLLHLYDSAGPELGLLLDNGSGRPAVRNGTTTTAFSGGTAPDTGWHSFALTINGTAAAFYLDGAADDTATITSQNIGSAVVLWVASRLNTDQFANVDIACLYLADEAADAGEVADMHAWAQVEFNLS